ncbi:hypothetical protein TWF506_006404 [Arthrobotrys conoides]|uniref:Uncharacterized protein n=1 Tax=Arthrobotrys conoides TaxID=74498 RepID=A0AAN8RUK7_9PEZI
MHTHNNHAGFGVVETLENLILDFVEAKDSLDEKWVICEILGYFFRTNHASLLFGVDDAERVNVLCVTLVRLFMSTLAALEHENLLGPNSRVKNLGTIMGLWMLAKSLFNGQGCVEADEDEVIESLGPKKDKKQWVPSSYAGVVLAYARNYNITLLARSGIETVIELCEEEMATEDVDLPVPESNSGPKADPFSFTSGLRKYKSD